MKGPPRKTCGTQPKVDYGVSSFPSRSQPYSDLCRCNVIVAYVVPNDIVRVQISLPAPSILLDFLKI